MPDGAEVRGMTVPERRLQYLRRSRGRESVWPGINLLSASVGRSFVSLAGGLLADGVRDGMMRPMNNGTGPAGASAAAVALDVWRTALSVCADVLQTAINAAADASSTGQNAFEAGARMCLSTLNAARASTANATGSMQGFGPATPSAPHFIPGGVLLGLSTVFLRFGAGRFALDTSKIDRKRAMLMASMSSSGFALVVAANAVAEFALNNDEELLQNAMLLPRLLSTYLILLSIAKSFFTCELVRGDAFLPHREWMQEQLGAWRLGTGRSVLVGGAAQPA